MYIMEQDRAYENSLIEVYKERSKRDVGHALQIIEDFLAFLEFNKLEIVKKVQDAS